MQPIPNGPNIPDELLRLHAEGKVVFFCGAGISCPAGLPGFEKLVNKVYARLGQEKSAIEKAEFRRNNYDRCLFLLEKRLNSPDMVRNAVHSILTKETQNSGIHSTLLSLSTTETGKTRIVTTNFDRLFVNAERLFRCKRYIAPQLPFVSHDEWSGIVYLHGLLPKTIDSETLRRVVMTSGDFGAAYLVDRWAARFLVELFTHYTVCFIGYSLNDPIVRYLTDSLDAARLHGERQIDHYAFCPETDIDSWRAKGIRPIGYKVTRTPIGKGRTKECHDNLYSTLKNWCDSIQNGDTTRTEIVDDCAWRDPRMNSPSDDFVGRLLWALDDPTGEAAKAFADADVKYPYEWLVEFDRPRFDDSHTVLLPFPESNRQNSGNCHSFISRPIQSPNGMLGFLSLATQHVDNVSDPVSRSLIEWFAKNLADIRFFFWAVRQQGVPTRAFMRAIHEKLAEYGTNGKDSPISETLRFLWQLYLTGRTQAGFSYDTLRMLDKEINHHGWSPFALELFRETAKPVFRLSDSAFVGYPIFESSNDPVGYWMMKLSCIGLEWRHYWEQWKEKLPGDTSRILTTAEQLLEDAVSMMETLRVPDDDESFASVDLFSSDCNRKNDETLPDLALLTRIVRDAWMVLAQNNASLANPFVKRWIRSKFAIFNRLALFAAASTNCVSGDVWTSWLLKSKGRFLWLPVFKRETCRLLALRGKELSPSSSKKLISAILAGPYAQKGWTQREIEEDVWVRLVKLSTEQHSLPRIAAGKLESLPKSNPALRLYADQKEEFPDGFHHWDGDRDEDRQFVRLPDDEAELLAWIETHSKHSDFDPSKLRFVTDDWQKKCADNPDKCLDVLLKAREHGCLPGKRWHDAFFAWGRTADPEAIVSRLGKSIDTFKNEELSVLADSFASFLKAVAPKCKKTFQAVVDLSMLLLERIRPDETEETFEPEFPTNCASTIAELFVDGIYPSKETDGVSVSAPVRGQMWKTFEKACSEPSSFCPSTASGIRRVLLKNANLFFGNNRDWATKHIVPLLKWKIHPKTASRHWDAFLRSSSFQLDFLREIKQDFFQAAEHLSDFKNSPGLHNYRMLVFSLALRRFRSFPKSAIRKCLSRYDQSGIDDFFKRMERTSMHRGAKGGVFWREKVSRFLEDYLPVVSDHRSESISESLSVIAIWSGDQFPHAWKMVEPYLRPVSGWYAIPASLDETRQCERHPKEALGLMLKTFDKNANFASVGELDRCLDAVLAHRSDLKRRARPLRDFSKRMHTILDS